MSKMKKTARISTSLFALAVSAWSPAFAQVSSIDTDQQAESTALDAGEIIVTAQRRAERLKDVPISVTALSADNLETAGVRDLFDIGLIAPGVKIQQYNGAILPMVRGVSSKTVGAGVDLPIATYVDGVYIGSPYATSSFNSIERIEILKGPQGTLFGRNATGGLIQIVTRDPKHTPGGSADFTYANFGTLRAQAYATGGLSDTIAMDIALGAQAQDRGWGINLANGQDVNKLHHELVARSKILFTPTENLEIRVSGDYADQHNSRFATQRPAFGVIPPAPYGPAFLGGDFDIASDRQPDFRSRGGGGSLRVDYDLGAIALASISAYRKSSYDLTFDSDYTAFPGRYASTRGEDEQFSQELQLQSDNSSRLNWTIGAYYYWADGRFNPIGTITYGTAPTPGAPLPETGRYTLADQTTQSLAGYGQASLKLTDALQVTLGLRYTNEKRELTASAYTVNPDGSAVVTTPEFGRSVEFNKLTWRAAVDYHLSPNSMIYASFNRGFKSGGFNTLVITLPSYAPETLDAYEIGSKNRFAGWLTLNLAAYYYDYTNIQVGRSINGLTGTYNAPGTEIYGADLDFIADITRNLRLSGGYSYVHGRYLDFSGAVIATPIAGGGYSVGTGNVAGNTTILSPEHTFSLAGNYRVAVGSGELSFDANYSYTSRYFHEPDNVLSQPGYSMVGASVRYETNIGLALMLWGKNLTNEAVQVVGGVQTFGTLGLARASYGEPRTYGVTLSAKF